MVICTTKILCIVALCPLIIIVNKYEIGKNVPTLQILEKIADALNISVVDLIIGPGGKLQEDNLSENEKELVNLTRELKKTKTRQ